CMAATRQDWPFGAQPRRGLDGTPAAMREHSPGMREWLVLLWPWSESGTFYLAGTGTFYLAATPLPSARVFSKIRCDTVERLSAKPQKPALGRPPRRCLPGTACSASGVEFAIGTRPC